MKITKPVHIQTEVEIWLGADDLRALLDELSVKPESAHQFIQGMKACGAFLNAVSDERIAAMNEAQRITFATFLKLQARRFSPDTFLPHVAAGQPQNTT